MGANIYALSANNTIVAIDPEPSELVLLATILLAWFIRRRRKAINRGA